MRKTVLQHRKAEPHSNRESAQKPPAVLIPPGAFERKTIPAYLIKRPVRKLQERSSYPVLQRELLRCGRFVLLI